MLKAPVLVWSLKLSSIEPCEYLDGWPPRNTRCWRQFCILIGFKTYKEHISDCRYEIQVQSSQGCQTTKQLQLDSLPQEVCINDWSSHMNSLSAGAKRLCLLHVSSVASTGSAKFCRKMAARKMWSETKFRVNLGSLQVFQQGLIKCIWSSHRNETARVHVKTPFC